MDFPTPKVLIQYTKYSILNSKDERICFKDPLDGVPYLHDFFEILNLYGVPYLLDQISGIRWGPLFS